MKNTSSMKLLGLLVCWVAMFLTVGATDMPVPQTSPTLALPNQQLNPTLRLEPSSGSTNVVITAIGEGWFPDTQITLVVLDGIIKYGVGGEKVDQAGHFEIDFLIPAHMKKRPLITIRARTVVGTTEGEATVEAIFGAEIAPSIQQPETSSNPEPAAVTVMEMTPEEQALCEAQQNATNISLAQVNTFTSGPAIAPVCNPSQWSGCGGASCAADHVSQCQPNGTWGECVWDPGFCSEDEDEDDEDDE